MRFAFVPVVVLAAAFVGAAETGLPALPVLEDGRYGYQEVVLSEGVEAPELLSRARAWVARTYESANAVIQLDDPAGTLVAKGIVEIPFRMGAWSVKHVVTIEVKSGRYRYTLSDFVFGELGVGVEDDEALLSYIPTKEGRAKMRGRIAEKSEGIITSLKAAMQVPSPAKSNW